MLQIIAEIGINYNGNFNLIEELIRTAKNSGADFAKFQIYSSMGVFGDESRKHNEISFDQMKQIKDICDAYDIKFLASVFDEERFEWYKTLKNVRHIKLASRTVAKDLTLCDNIINNSGMTVFASLGMLQDPWEKYRHETDCFSRSNVKYFNCISKYPTDLKTLQAAEYIEYDRKIVGLSDHSYGIANCLREISYGATVIEKHFTLDKTMVGNDHIGSMTPTELKLLRELGNEIYAIGKLNEKI